MAKKRKIIIFFSLIFVLTGIKSFATTGTVSAPSGLVLRETASKSSNPITTVNDKETVEIVETLDEWYKVKYNESEGFLYKQYVNVEEEKNEEVEIEKKNEKTENEEIAVEENTETTQELTTTENNIFPKEATITQTAKVYVMPSITSTVMNNIETGTNITITKGVNSWLYVSFENGSGWIRKSFISSETVENPVEEAQENEEEPKEQENTKQEEPKVSEQQYESKKGYINVSTSANLRETASTSAKIITTLTTNTGITIIGEEGDWYKITYENYTGYISKSLVSDTPVTTSRGNIDRTQNTEKVEESVTPSYSGDGNIASTAQQYIGYSYVYGGSTPDGFDCSGFTQYICGLCGYSINRTASSQFYNGEEVSRDNLQAGDLIFFNNTSDGSIGHVGIYIGGGTIVHAANSRRGVTTDTINSGYYNTYYYGARRLSN